MCKFVKVVKSILSMINPDQEQNVFVTETPCGQLPMLTYNGTEISQSMAIARLIAREFNLAGHSRLEEAQVDMIVDCMTDLMTGETD